MTQPTLPPIRVTIVDDHAIVRQGLRTLLTQMGLDVVGEATNGDEAVTLAQDKKPDVMLLDIRMKRGDGADSDGLTALPFIKAASPQTSVIILTTYSNPTYLSRAVCNGASGYLVKDSEPEEIVAAIEAAARHRHLFDPALLNTALQQQHAPVIDESPSDDAPATTSTGKLMAGDMVEPISEREYDVLQLMATGLPNAAIADQLNVSITTVKTHVTHILRKLNVNDRTQAVVMAMRLGLVE